jgi:hypothetical protein
VESRIDDLGKVMLSVDAVQRWSDMAGEVVEFMKKNGVTKLSQIPDECGRIEDDGSFTLYIVAPNGKEFSMRIQPDEWAYMPS